MTHALFASLSVLALAAAPPAGPEAVGGTVRVTTPAAAADQPATALALETADGTKLTIAKDDGSVMLFLDAALRDRPVRLTVRRDAATKALVVEKVQVLKDKKSFDVDYWCANCLLSYTQPGRCLCCGSETVRREQPAEAEATPKK